MSGSVKARFAAFDNGAERGPRPTPVHGVT